MVGNATVYDDWTQPKARLTSRAFRIDKPQISVDVGLETVFSLLRSLQ
jgi:hypothetical protein